MSDDLMLTEKQLSVLITLVNNARKKRIRRSQRSTFVPEPGHKDMNIQTVNDLEALAFLLREARRRLQEDAA